MNEYTQMTRELEYQANKAREISEDTYWNEEVRVAAARRMVLLREAIATVPMVPATCDSEGRPW